MIPPFIVFSLQQRNLLTRAVAGAGELLREARREDCRRRCRDFEDEGSVIAVAKPLLLRQIALAATAPGAARRGTTLAEQLEEEIKLACMVTLILLRTRATENTPARKETRK